MIAYYNSPFGIIELRANTGNQLTHLSFISDKQTIDLKHNVHTNNVLTQAIKQLTEYFSGQRTTFDLPLAPQGTLFQQTTWQALQSLTYGETQSYAWLANKINNPKAVRAVGRANGANPIAIIIPCHRIIGANGTLTGYAGGLSLKEKLLTLENASFISLKQTTP
jgi:methylated-DNA-[protein]-cysteine S-methyltransferase